jgi:hypothetical protein
MKSILLQVDDALKRRLDQLREQGISTNGYIRYILKRELDRHQRPRRRGRR